jgi:hypothetical protein
MTSRATRRFWKLYQELPESVQWLAVKNYRLWRDNPRHPSLDFKKLAGQGERFSIRVGDHYRALGHKISDGYEWVWIGSLKITINCLTEIGPDVLRHRIILTYEAEAQAVTTDAIIKKVFNAVPVP